MNNALEVTQDLIKRFDIPMELKEGTILLQDVTLRLTPDDFPQLTCEYVIIKKEDDTIPIQYEG